jgi:hypothetical protein
MASELNNYIINNVYQNIDAITRTKIIDLWTGNQVMSTTEAEKRVREVLLTIANPSGRLCGVNTVYVTSFMAQDNDYYYMRAFIRKEDRGVSGLLLSVTTKTISYLKTYKSSAFSPKGILIIVENQKIWRKGYRRYLERHDWNYLGMGPKGNHIWYQNFDGSLMPPDIIQQFQT